MSYFGGLSENMSTFSRLQEKEELKYLNDRLVAYFRHIRQFGQQGHNNDSSAFLKSTKILEDEIVKLKSLYESELDKLRKEIENSLHERNTLCIQHNKQQQLVEELQNRLSIETENAQTLLTEINALKRKLVQAEILNSKKTLDNPEQNVEQLHRNISNLMREIDQWKHRYDYEKIARQEAEDKFEQIKKKIEFSEQVHKQQITDYQARLDTATASILSLESRLREQSKTDISVADTLNQIRDSAEIEMRKYQMDSEELYSRNLSVLKAQIDNDANTIQCLTKEKSELIGSVSELHAKIRNLEGQIFNLLHQTETLEKTLSSERNKTAENINHLEKRYREVQDTLVVKMQEITNARDANISLKAEIEALKMLLEEEEQRLYVSASIDHSTLKQFPSASQTMSDQSMNGAISSNYHSNYGQQSLADSKKAVLLQSAAAGASPIYINDTFSPPMNYMSPTDSGNVDFTESCNQLINEETIQTLNSCESSPPHMMYKSEEGNKHFDDDEYLGESNLPLTAPNYHYESNPSINKVHAQTDEQKIKRAKSAPISLGRYLTAQEEQYQNQELQKNMSLALPYTATDGDAFKELFNDFQKETLFPKQRPKSSPLKQGTFQDYNVTTSSAIGDLKILEVNLDGKYVRLLNDGPSDMELGGFMIQQNIGGHPVAVFRFPTQIKFPSDSTITVWSGVNDSNIHNPPHEFYWKELYRWGAGPECTTILCRPSGQAVAWYTTAHRIANDAYIQPNASQLYKDAKDKKENGAKEKQEALTEINNDYVSTKSEPVFLKREKQQPPSLSAAKHPHGHTPNASIHPHNGNDNSSCVYQPRAQSCRSEPIAGRSSWATPQRMGSAPLRKMGGNQGTFYPTPGNKLVGPIRLTPSQTPFTQPSRTIF